MTRAKLTLEEQEHTSRGKFKELSRKIVDTSSAFYRRGWLYATSGNLSAVAEETPFRLAITASGVDKGSLTASHVIGIDEYGAIRDGQFRPSSETLIHLMIVKKLGAKSVMHTHSIWGTLLSEKFSGNGGIEISGYEMLKGLRGVGSHQNSEWIPILENSQDMKQICTELAGVFSRNPGIHGFLLRGHGLYTWGDSIEDAKRHVEALEFLLEVYGRLKLVAT